MENIISARGMYSDCRICCRVCLGVVCIVGLSEFDDNDDRASSYLRRDDFFFRRAAPIYKVLKWSKGCNETL